MEKQTRLFVTIISLTTVLAIIISCWKLSQPGLYFDEMLFVNGATGAHSDLFIRYKFMGIPVLLMDYIGALKAWIYYPIFALFGVNTWSVRLPAILIGTAGGLMLVAALWRGFGPRAALAGAMMILLDPTMIIHSRLDWGPNALMFFFRGLLVFSVVNWLKTLQVRWAWIAVIAAAFGIFDKLNFIWMTCATMGALVFIYPDKLKSFIRKNRIQALLLTIISIGGVGLAILRGIILSEHTDVSWGNRIDYAINLLRVTISGGGALNFIAGDGMRVEKFFWLGYLLPVLISIWGIRKLIKDNNSKRLFIWLAVLNLLVVLAFIATKTATGPHHVSMLCGLWQLLLAPLVAMVWDKLSERITIGKVVYTTSLVLVVACSMLVVFTCINAFAKPTNTNWDPANWQAARIAEKYPNANFICTDWGMATLAVGLNRQSNNIYDYWPSFVKSDDAVQTIQSMDRKKDNYIYSTLSQFENFKGNRQNLFHALELNNIKPRLYATYLNCQGKPMVEVLYIPAL